MPRGVYNHKKRQTSDRFVAGKRYIRKVTACVNSNDDTSFMVNIPIAWARGNGIQKGDKLTITTMSRALIIQQEG